jgi:hypothetical protein
MVGLEALAILLLALWAKDTVKREVSTLRKWSRRDAQSEIADRLAPTIISRTIIEPPKTFADDPDKPAPAGRHPVAHLRRGHPHTVLSGPRDAERIRTVKWFAPTWVGVDPDYAKTRKYRLTP